MPLWIVDNWLDIQNNFCCSKNADDDESLVCLPIGMDDDICLEIMSMQLIFENIHQFQSNFRFSFCKYFLSQMNLTILIFEVDFWEALWAIWLIFLTKRVERRMSEKNFNFEEIFKFLFANSEKCVRKNEWWCLCLLKDVLWWATKVVLSHCIRHLSGGGPKKKKKFLVYDVRDCVGY